MPSDSGKTEGLWNEHVRAILVGVTDYSALPNTSDLPPGRQDVELMSKALVYGLHVHPLHIWTKTKDADAGRITRRSFLAGIRLFLSDCSTDDILIFYFSGHGQIMDGKHWLVFSDGAIETQSVIDLFSRYHADKRILLLDCCMSGLYTLHDSKGIGGLANRVGNKAVPDGDIWNSGEWITDLLQGGTAVFASGRPDEPSGYNGESSASVFTTFLWDAMTNRFYLQDGKLSLDRIRELVYRDAEAWNERNTDRTQHPVFRSSIVGPVYFRVAGVSPYRQKEYSLDRQDFRIVSVAPLHSQIAKRYVVKVILKRHVTEADLIRINQEIIAVIRPLDMYKTVKEEQRWRNHPADLIFSYFGYSQDDVTQGNYEFYTIWASEGQDRAHWYKQKPGSKVAGDIFIRRNPAYGWLLKYTQENLAGDRWLLDREGTLIRKAVGDGEELLQRWQEWINSGQMTEEEKSILLKLCAQIDSEYIALSELLLPSAQLAAWDRAVSDVAGDIENFSILVRKALKEDAISDETAFLMDEEIKRYHMDLDRFAAEDRKPPE